MLNIIKSIFSELGEEYSFFGLGTNAFNRLGPESFINNYHILCLRNSLENKIIKKDIDLFSLEEQLDTKDLRPRNSNTIIKDSLAQSYIKSHSLPNKKPVLIVYKPFLSMQRIAQKNNWFLCANPYKFGKKLFENKIIFRQILEKLNLPVPPGEIINKIQDLLKNFDYFAEKYGLPLVIQHPTRGGGRGTFFVYSKKSLKKIIPYVKEKFLVLKFIKGPSPSITGSVTPWGIALTRPQYQILSMPSCFNLEKKIGNGLWCGHDWSFSANHLSPTVLQNIYQASQRIGEYLRAKGYRGIFGLDFIKAEKDEEIYISECNPRFLGSMPVLTMTQLSNGEVPILAIHILSFLPLNKKHNDIMRHIFSNINDSIKKPKKGAQLVIHNQEGRWASNQKEIKPGVYHLKNDRLNFIREGYALKDIKNREEFLLADGLPYKGTVFKTNQRIMRLITANQVLKDYLHLNPWAQKIAQVSYQALEMKPAYQWRFLKFFRRRRRGRS